MKILIDAMSAEYGGIRTYVEQLLGHWHLAFPDDEIHVALASGATLATGPHVRHELVVRRPAVLGRPWAQTRELSRIVETVGAEVVLATMPSTTMRNPGCPVVVVVHDLRHQLRPEQFSAARRLMRRVAYGRAYSVADAFVSVSHRTADDLARCQPSTTAKPGVVAHHGADHVLEWPTADRSGPAMAFAHHSNKNPGLILEAWAIMAKHAAPPPILIVGLGAEGRAVLQPMVESLRLEPYVELAAYLPDHEFQQAMARANMIIFPSDFEGFGLPVVEGMTLGKPVVIGPDEGTTEVAGGHAVVMTDWSAEALADAAVAAGRMSDQALETARTWGAGYTWNRSVRQTRDILDRLASSRS